MNPKFSISNQENDNNFEKKSFIEKLFYFSLSIPFLKINSLFSGSLIIGLLIILYMILIKKYKVDRYAFFTILLFLIGELLAIKNCPNFVRTFDASIKKIIVIFLLYPIMKFSIKNNGDKFKMANIYKIGCIISSLIVILFVLFKIDLGFVEFGYGTDRVILAGYGPNVIARLFCIGALFSLYEAQIFNGSKKLRNYIYYFICSLAIIATVSMSGILILIIGTIIIYLTNNKGIKKIGIFKFFIILIVIMLGVFLLYRNVHGINEMITKYMVRMSYTSDDFSNGRLKGLTNLWFYITKYWLNGIGYACSNYLVGTTIHFPIIASMVETGIFGLMSCLILYGYPFVLCIKKIYKNKKLDIYAFISVLIIAGDMIQPNPNYIFVWFAIFLGLISEDGVSSRNVKKSI